MHSKIRPMLGAATITAAILAIGVMSMSTGTANAAMVEETYTGTFDFSQGPPGSTDVLGLDGATFIWKGTFDTTAPRVFTNNVNLDRFAGTITLQIAGSTAGNDGTYSPDSQSTVGEVIIITGGADQYQLSNAANFAIGGELLNVGVIQVPQGFTGAISPTNTFTPFDSSNVISFQPWNSFTDGGDPDGNNAFYSVIGPQVGVAVVPEPASLGLLGLAAFGLLGRRRRTQ